MEEGKEITLTLTKHDLEGKFMYASDCPIARALKRKFPNETLIDGGPFVARVGEYRFRINQDDENKLCNPKFWGEALPGDTVRLTPLQTVTCDCC